MKQDIVFRKMKHSGNPVLEYSLGELPISDYVGRHIALKFEGKIECIACGRNIKKTFNQGYCFPCFQSLARCDLCIVKPELCHFAKGTCREPEWGKQHCLVEHVVYLARTSSLKVGVTGAHKVRERWGDQGAREALIIARCPERLVAGQLEDSLKEFMNDKTDWRGLLKGVVADVDLEGEAHELLGKVPEHFENVLVDPGEYRTDQLEYPVNKFLSKAVVHNFDKIPELTGEFHGIVGQYLLVGDAGLNVRKYQGYRVALELL
ncbi:MAG: DUF2797 domain-containing protein [Bdellovibrionales bacterium]|nr:DUF2797 domain-containing protein [Bdellovibrionales bacterium]